MVYYNEFDSRAAAWLRELIKAGLIADGVVDEHSIEDVQPGDLDGFVQCHWFAGIGGWSYALRLAGWPDDVPVWTGSCPCQPFSCAGKRAGEQDKRDLWPEMRRLIEACRPPIVFGEQVASAETIGTRTEADFLAAVHGRDFGRANKLAKRLARSNGFHEGPRWVDRVCADLATIDYVFGFKVLGAHSVRAPHVRQRVFWLADRDGQRLEKWMQQDGCSEQRELEPSRRPDAMRCGIRLPDAERAERRPDEQRYADTSGREQATGGLGGDGAVGMADADNSRPRTGEPGVEGLAAEQRRDRSTVCGDGLANAESDGRDERGTEPGRRLIECGRGRLGDSIGERWASGHVGSEIDASASRPINAGFWDDYELISFRDGKTRRVKPGVEPLVARLSDTVVRSGDSCDANNTAEARNARLKGYGNSIVPQVAAAFIEASVEAMKARRQ